MTNSALAKKVMNANQLDSLWEKGSKILIGVSGGPDSVCLLNLFYFLAPKYDLKIAVAHVNYGLRQKDSGEDAKFVAKICQAKKIPFYLLDKPPIPSKGNLEENLRKIRYRFFEKIRQQSSFDLIAVAHNQDDQAETVLMRILRGSGLRGISAISAKSGVLIRPLLEISRSEIMSYLKSNKLKFRLDKSNFDTKFERNKLRQELLPYLEKNYSPKIKLHLANLAKTSGQDLASLENLAHQFVSKNVLFEGRTAQFQVSKALLLEKNLLTYVLTIIAERILNSNYPQESGFFREATKIIYSTKGKKQFAIFSGLKISRIGDKIYLLPTK